MSWLSPPIPLMIGDVQVTCETISDEIAHSVARHSYPGRDGADLERMGAEAVQTRITGALYGADWLVRLAALELYCSRGTEVAMQHPFRGLMNGAVTSLTPVHDADEHNKVRLDITFVQGQTVRQAFTAAVTATSAAAAVRAAAAEAEAARAALGAS